MTTPTDRESVDSLIRFIEHNAKYEELEALDKEAYDLASSTLRALLVRAEAAEAWRDRLREAAVEVENWWLSDGKKSFYGAPYAMFAIRSALKDTTND